MTTTSSKADGLWVLARDAAVAGSQAARAALGGEARRGECHDMAGHIGSPHLPVDVVAHEAVERFVYGAHRGPVQIVGEEVHRSLWTPVGGLVVTVDPVDGTGPATDLGFGWSTVVLVHRLARVGGWRLVGAAVSLSSGLCISYKAPGVVVVDDVLGGTSRVAAITGSGSGAIAAVGAKQTTRERWRAAVGPEAATVYNLGGSPTAWGLLCGRLSASVVLGSSTQWDAVHVLLASEAGARVATGDGIVPAAQVRAWFAAPPFDDGDSHPVPPCAVARDADTALALATRTARAPRPELVLESSDA